jgi:hypothetical protein
MIKPRVDSVYCQSNSERAEEAFARRLENLEKEARKEKYLEKESTFAGTPYKPRREGAVLA